jgi:hypothetical protein
MSTDTVLIITNLLVVVSTLALVMVTMADVVKDTHATMVDIVRMVIKAQRSQRSHKDGE